MVDEAAILENFKKYFEGGGRLVADNNVHIDAKGQLNVMGNVSVKPRYTAHESAGLPYGKIPVQFRTVSGSFNVSNCGLKSLEGCPTSVGNICRISNNPITTLHGAPQSIAYLFVMEDLPQLTSLEGFGSDVNICRFSWQANLPLLRLLMAKRLILGTDHLSEPPNSPAKRCIQILTKYAGEGKRGAIRCQKELIAAGFEGNARW
jgi:hypothetical protein